MKLHAKRRSVAHATRAYQSILHSAKGGLHPQCAPSPPQRRAGVPSSLRSGTAVVLWRVATTRCNACELTRPLVPVYAAKCSAKEAVGVVVGVAIHRRYTLKARRQGTARRRYHWEVVGYGGKVVVPLEEHSTSAPVVGPLRRPVMFEPTGGVEQPAPSGLLHGSTTRTHLEECKHEWYRNEVAPPRVVAVLAKPDKPVHLHAEHSCSCAVY